MHCKALIRACLIGATLWMAMVAGSLGEDGPWRVGIARAKITPSEPLWMAGYAARDHAAEGTLHDLWLKVLALEAADGNRAVIVTSDLLGFPKAMADRICTAIQARCALERSQIMLTSSHTHCGPVLSAALLDIYPLDEAQQAKIEAYSAALEARVVATVEEAFKNLQPAILSAGEGKAGFAANRRANSEKDVIEARQAGLPTKGPSDHTVPVLAVRSPEGALRAVVFGYACHNTTLAFYQWCGDYAGFAQLALEQAHPGTTAMFTIGCGGDQNPLPRRTVELCQQYGEELAKAVREVLAQPMRPIPPHLRTAMAWVPLKLEPPSEAELQQKAQGTGYAARWASRLLQERQAGKPWMTEYPYPVQVWKLGTAQLWIVLGGEVVVDYALRFKQEFGPTTWVTAYANDVMAYIPSHRVWQEGGYEAGAFSVYGLPADRWEETIEDRIAQAVAQLAERVEWVRPCQGSAWWRQSEQRNWGGGRLKPEPPDHAWMLRLSAGRPPGFGPRSLPSKPGQKLLQARG